MKTAEVGDPSKPAALGAAVQAAYDAGARKIIIRPGTYLVPSSDNDVILLSNWQDATVSAYGATIVTDQQKWPTAAFHLQHCTNVSVEGPLLSQTHVTVYQGKVSAVGTDSSGEFYCDWSPDAGYPQMRLESGKGPEINVIDAHTRRLKMGLGDYYNVKWQSQGGDAFRLTGFGNTAPNISVGDWIVARADGGTAIKVFLEDCGNCMVRDVSMMRNGFAPIFETGGDGGNHILHCKWMLGPRPDGATEDPLVTNMADGFHSSGTRVGPDIEDCVMEGVFLDDCFAIHGSFSDVVTVTGSQIALKGRAKFAAGDPVIVCDQHGLYEKATITAVQAGPDGQSGTITTDQTLAVPAGSKAFDPNFCGAGFKIINCHLGSTRSRGILVKADNGLIKGNTIVGCMMSAVSIGPEFYWNEAGYVDNTVVTGNKIINCGGAPYGGPAIFLHGDGSIGNSNITISNNSITGCYQGDIEVQWSHDVEISGNSFVGVKNWPAGRKKHPVIWIANAKNVNIAGSKASNLASYDNPPVSTGDNVTGLKNDDESMFAQH